MKESKLGLNKLSRAVCVEGTCSTCGVSNFYRVEDSKIGKIEVEVYECKNGCGEKIFKATNCFGVKLTFRAKDIDEDTLFEMLQYGMHDATTDFEIEDVLEHEDLSTEGEAALRLLAKLRKEDSLYNRVMFDYKDKLTLDYIMVQIQLIKDNFYDCCAELNDERCIEEITRDKDRLIWLKTAFDYRINELLDSAE